LKDADTHIAALLSRIETREKGFELLVERYKRPLYARIRSMVHSHDDADDALQNTFLKIWSNVDSFRGTSTLFTWVYRIATNEALMILRRAKRHPDADLHDPPVDKGIADGPTADEISEKLRRAVENLPEKQRLIFEMRYFAEMPYAEIAALTHTTPGALKASYHHAVKKIEHELKS